MGKKSRFSNLAIIFEWNVLRTWDAIITKKNVSIRALPEFGGGLPLPEFFCNVFLLSKSLLNHESRVELTAEKVGKVARIGGWEGFG